MPEILTESFCERCGTRYTFQSTTPKVGRMAKMKTLSRGLKNYVLSDDASLDEALADARSTDDRQQSVEQLDAFHKTFNFCMSCRQYTCANCWNDREGRCLSCAPGLASASGSAFPDLNPVAGLAGLSLTGNGQASGNGHAEPGQAWPAASLSADAPVVSRLEALFGRTAAEPIPGDPDTSAEAAADAADEGPRKPELIGLEGVAVADDEAVDAGATDETEETATPMAAGAPAIEADDALEIDEAAAVAPATADEVEAAEPDFEAAAVADTAAEDMAPADEQAAPHAATEPIVHEIDPETDGLAAAAAAQTAQLLDRFRAKPVVIPAPASRPAADVSPMARPMPASSPLPPPYAASATPTPVPGPAQPQVPAPGSSYAPPPYGGPAQPYAAGPYPPASAPYAPATPQYPPAMPYAPGPAPYAPPPAQYAVPPAPAYPAPPPVAAAYPPPVQPYPAAPPPYAEPAYQAYPAVQPQYAPPVAPRPSWRMVAPEVPVQPQPQNGRTYEGPPPEPEWPSAPQWPAPVAGKGRDHTADAVWAESTRDLLNKTETGVSACFNCGLPLSATARFCRRCGTSQVSS